LAGAFAVFVGFVSFAAIIAGAWVGGWAFLVRERSGIDAQLLLHHFAMRNGRAVIYGRALLLIVRGVSRDGRRDGKNTCHKGHHVTSRLTSRSVVLLTLVKANRRETIMKRLDIAIAGCGVAGLSVAALLRQMGANVVIFDKLEAPQPLGSGIIVQPVGLHVLDLIGAGLAIRELGAPVTRLFGKAAPNQNVVLDVRYADRGRDAPCGLGVHRGALFQVLYDAALAAGAEIESGREVVGVRDRRLVFADGGVSATFDLIVDALGMRSPLAGAPPKPLAFGALWASLDWAGPFDQAALEQRYRQARKMVGVMPIGFGPPASSRHAGKMPAVRMAAFFWSLKHADRAAWAATPIEAWKDDVRALWPETEPLLAQINTHSDLVFATYAHRTLADPVARDCVHVGDSWHCTSPQLGQGANMALLDALALARALETQSNLDAALGEYGRLRTLHIQLYQLASFLFTPAYQSDSAAFAFVRDWIMSPLSRTPPAPAVLARLVAGEIGSPLRAMRK
jgi:salicylate hydroxylase